jgi:prophage regulatory protein
MKYLRYADLKRFGIPFSRQHLRRLIAAGLFPEPVRLGPGTIAWPEDDLRAYDERIRAERDIKQSARQPAARARGGDNARPTA